MYVAAGRPPIQEGSNDRWVLGCPGKNGARMRVSPHTGLHLVPDTEPIPFRPLPSQDSQVLLQAGMSAFLNLSCSTEQLKGTDFSKHCRDDLGRIFCFTATGLLKGTMLKAIALEQQRSVLLTLIQPLPPLPSIPSRSLPKRKIEQTKIWKFPKKCKTQFPNTVAIP